MCRYVFWLGNQLFTHNTTALIALFFPFLGFAIVGLTRQSYIVSEGDHLRICLEIIEGELKQGGVFTLRPGINENATSGYHYLCAVASTSLH